MGPTLVWYLLGIGAAAIRSRIYGMDVLSGGRSRHSGNGGGGRGQHCGGGSSRGRHGDGGSRGCMSSDDGSSDDCSRVGLELPVGGGEDCLCNTLKYTLVVFNMLGYYVGIN